MSAYSRRLRGTCTARSVSRWNRRSSCAVQTLETVHLVTPPGRDGDEINVAAAWLMKSTFQSSSNITEHQVTSQVPRSCSASLSTCRSRPVWEALNPFRASIKFIQKTGRLHFATSFTEKLKMIRCVARVRASSSTTELLVNGEGHRCRWFIYSPGEAFKLLKSISSADKLTYWSKATKDVICWSEQPWGHLGERKILFLLSSPVVGATGALKLSAESLFSPLFLWLQIDFF